MNLEHLLPVKQGSKHNVQHEALETRLQLDKINHIFIFCPNMKCRQHLKLSKRCILCKCPSCKLLFNPFSNMIIKCLKCQQLLSVSLQAQVIQCTNIECQCVLNLGGFQYFNKNEFDIELLNAKPKEAKENEADIYEQYRNRLKMKVQETDMNEESDLKTIEREDKMQIKTQVIESMGNNEFLIRQQLPSTSNSNCDQNSSMSKVEGIHKISAFDDFCVGNNDGKQPSLIIKKRIGIHKIHKHVKQARTPFQMYFKYNVHEWKQKFIFLNSLQILQQMNKYWTMSASEEEKQIYIKKSVQDKERYKNELFEQSKLKWIFK